MMAAPETWSEIVRPIVTKCEVGAAFGDRVFFTKEGADALGKLIKEMAENLDDAHGQGLKEPK